MNTFLTILIVGLATASIYAVAASGLVLTYTTSGIFNFAHGAIAMVSAFVFWQLHSPAAWGLPTPVALVLTLGGFAPGFGWLIDRVIMRRLHDASPMIRIVVPIGLMVALIQGASVVWPPNEVNAKLSDFYLGRSITIFDVAVSYHNLIVLASAVAVAIALRILLYRTRTGIAMRGVVESRDLTALNGADPDRLSGLAWALGSALAGLAGILIAPLLSLDQVSLTLLVVNAFAAAVVGRLRSLPLTALGALILGLLTETVRTYGTSIDRFFTRTHLPTGWVTPDTAPVLMLFVALLVIPQDKASVFTQIKDRGRVPNPSLRTAAIAGLVLVAVAVIIPSLMEGNILDAIGTGLALGIVALSLVPLTGYAGQLSLAPLAFAGIGAVVMNKFGADGNPLALLAVIVVCAAVGVLVALPALRLKGLYLALATLAFARFCELTLFTNVAAEQNLEVYTPLGLGDDLRAASPRAQLVVMAIVFALLGVGITILRRGPFGRRLQALKDSPAACSTLGLNLTLVKVQVFALSAAIAGVGGAFSAIWRGQFDNSQFSLLEGSLPGLPLVLLAVVGGIAAVAGALLGGVLLAVMPQVGATYPALENLMTILPGLAGISLAANPDGAIAQTVTQVRASWTRLRHHDGPAEDTLGSRLMAGLVPPPPTVVPELVGASGRIRATDLAVLDAETGLDWGRCHAAAGDE